LFGAVELLGMTEKSLKEAEVSALLEELLVEVEFPVVF
jgi:hypothetical protein